MIITDAKLFLDDLAGRSTILRAHRDQENGREVAEQLIADIEAASQKDRFLRAGTMFTVSGRVPINGSAVHAITTVGFGWR